MKLFPCAVLLLFAAVFPSCAIDRPSYLSQIQDLVLDLDDLSPSSPEAVFRHASLLTLDLQLNIQGIQEDIITVMLMEDQSWSGILLCAYLLALSEDVQGLNRMIHLIHHGGLAIDERDGLHFCCLKLLGVTEGESPQDVNRLNEDMDWIEKAHKSIQKIGVNRWRLELIQDLVIAGDPEAGEELNKHAKWLRWKLKGRDAPFLGDLLEKGGDLCDTALLDMIETVLMKRFRPAQGEDRLKAGIRAFKKWRQENGALRPDAWITASFAEAGCETDDVFNQSAMARVAFGLYDASENKILVRSRSLDVLNRICGFHVDRNLIFMEEEVRKEADQAFKNWALDLAARIMYE